MKFDPKRLIYHKKREEVVSFETSLVDHAKDKLLYHELAEFFDLAVSRNTERELSFLGDIIRKFAPLTRDIVDLGCGVGRHSGGLSERFGYFVLGSLR
jgi:hypothetical protein